MEPWDGPAAVTYTDGRIVGTILDRNGLRPARYVILDNGFVISASEVGSVKYDESRVIKKGRLGPGQIFCVDTTRGIVMNDEEITRYFSGRRPYAKWIEQNLLPLKSVPTPADFALPPLKEATPETPAESNGSNGRRAKPPKREENEALIRRQLGFGYTSEEDVVVLRPMVVDGKEAIGAMGDDTPPAALSKLPRPLFQYFKQRFAEVTNPPIDPLREEMVMSLRVLLGQRANVLSELPEATRLIELKSPVLQPEDMAKLRAMSQPEFAAMTIDATWPAPEEGSTENTEEQTQRTQREGENSVSAVNNSVPSVVNAGDLLRAAVERLCRQAEEAVRAGARILIVSDQKCDEHTLPIPSLLAMGAVHHHLIRNGLRMNASLISESGEPREVHHVAALIGYGANAIYPYLSLRDD